ncbi:MAG: VWA domain-containing protein [Clostridia bacterium]|nr:VWA domain-containing protein [Clostridia bacterium]
MENKDRTLGEGIARQELQLIFIIDNSGSMEGEKIGAVNNAIRDVMSMMPEVQEDTADATIKISALKFSDEAKWVYSEPQTVNEFKWKDLKSEGGTNLSSAYDELAKWLCKKEKGGKMPDIGGVAPILILMTDGMPTSYDWENHLAILKHKGWFKVALKYALAIGIDTDEAMDVLRKFTGNPETVLKVYTAEALRKVIKVIAVTASKVKSNSASAGYGGALGASNNDVAKNEIAEKLDDIQDVEW